VALMITVTLVIWQGSFDFGGYGPNGPEQTFIFWAISILIFLLMVTLAFMLVRIGVKLYIERRSNRQGSRIKTKLLIGALALSVTPIFFMVLFSVHVLNRNLDKWFSRPADQERLELVQIAKLLQDQARENAEAHAELLGSQPETLRLLATGQKIPGRLNQFCREHNLAAAEIRGPNGQVLDACGSRDAFRSQDEDTVMVTQSIEAGGKVLGAIVLSPQIPVDVAQKRQAIKAYDRYYAQLAGSRRGVRLGYILLMALITLFVLFVATWIALFLSKQISVPIAALLEAAGEVRKGNLSYRVQVPAIDELAALVSGFNAMTRDLESNSVELDARRRFTEAILESIPTGVISVASDGRIQRVNRALKRILPEEQVARATRLEDLFSREDTAEIRYLMKRARRTGLTSRQLELRGEHRTLHLSITVSALEERLRSGFVIVLEDTSDLLRAQKAAAWNEVARRVAHEIKNPLTPISLSAERMARHLERVGLAPESARIVRECTDTIVKEVDSVKNLVDAFSQFARFPAVQPVRSDLNEVVESALTVFSGRLDGIEVRTEFAPGLAQVNIDREQFKRMVVNLVDNAAEAMQDSLVKRLLIATQPGTADTVELIVADTGCGVTAEDKEKLFLPYFSTKGRGTGLGLAIVNHILADHNAHIRVEDNVPAGARFFVEIPAIVEGVDEPRQPEPPAVMTSTAGSLAIVRAARV